MGYSDEEQTTITNMDSTTCIKVPTIITEDGELKLVDNSTLKIVVGEVTITLSNNGKKEGGENKENPILNRSTMRIYSKADPGYFLAIRDRKVILAGADSSDACQLWIKHENTEVKDKEGNPSFALVNKATGEAIKHSTGDRYPVQLTDYNPTDESILWTQSNDLGDSYKTIRMVNNIQLVFDAFNGIKKHGGVRDGTDIVLWEWVRGENQLWKFDPYTIGTYKEDEETIINIPKIATTEDGASTVPVDDPVLKITIGGFTFQLSNNGNNPKRVIGIDGSDGKGARDNERSGTKDDTIITKRDEQIKQLREQNKSLLEIIQGTSNKEDAMDKGIKALQEQNKSLQEQIKSIQDQIKDDALITNMDGQIKLIQDQIELIQGNGNKDDATIIKMDEQIQSLQKQIESLQIKNKKEDATNTETDKQIKSLEEQIKLLQEKSNKEEATNMKMEEQMTLIQEQLKTFQGKGNKEDAMDRQINLLREQIEVLQDGTGKLHYGHISGSSIKFDSGSGEYNIVCPSCNYYSGMAWKRGTNDGRAVDAILGRGLHVRENGNEFIISGVTALSVTPQKFNYRVVGKTVSQRGPPYFGLNVHCPWCAINLGRNYADVNYEYDVKAGKHNHDLLSFAVLADDSLKFN